MQGLRPVFNERSSLKMSPVRPTVVTLRFLFITCYKDFFNVHGYVHRKYIPLYPTRCKFNTVYLYLETALHVSGGTSIHHQERTQLYLQHLVFVTRLKLPAAIAAGSSNRVTNTRCCRYSCMRS